MYKAERSYTKALKILEGGFKLNEYVEIYELIGLMREKEDLWGKSLVLYEKALAEMSRYIPKENEKLKTLKARIDFCLVKIGQDSKYSKSHEKGSSGSNSKNKMINELDRIKVTDSLTIDPLEHSAGIGIHSNSAHSSKANNAKSIFERKGNRYQYDNK